MIEQSASEIIQSYYKALAAGDESQVSSFLWDDFKEINSDLGTIDKPTYMDMINGNGNHNILAISAVGNIVKVKYQNDIQGISPVKQKVFAVVDDKIKLEVIL